MPTVLNSHFIGRAKKSKNQVYVGRPSKWGNPFVIGRDGTREEVVEKYYLWLQDQELLNDISELEGKDLVCWCDPLPCHADVLIRLANDRETIY